MYIYFFAGAFLLVAIIFVIKFLVDRKKSETQKAEPVASDKNDVVIVTDDADNKEALAAKPKKDMIIALIFMALCEACILLGNYVVNK